MCWETIKNFHQQILSCLRKRNKAVPSLDSGSTAGVSRAMVTSV